MLEGREVIISERSRNQTDGRKRLDWDDRRGVMVWPVTKRQRSLHLICRSRSLIFVVFAAFAVTVDFRSCGSFSVIGCVQDLLNLVS
jgi:hypothetical protein